MQIFLAIAMLIGVPVALTLAWRNEVRPFVWVVLAMLMLSALSLLIGYVYFKAGAFGEHEDWSALFLFELGLYAFPISLATGLIGWGLTKLAEKRQTEQRRNY